MDKFVIYDEEHLINFSSFYFIDYKTERERVFVLHESRNDLKDLFKFIRSIRKKGYYCVGYNNLNYDGQILEYILKNPKKLLSLSTQEVIEKLHNESTRLISLKDPKDRFGNTTPEWKLSVLQLDLMKQQHYDYRAKMTSLKWLEFTMRFPSIESMPFSHTHHVTAYEVDKILSYNRNDVAATKEFFKRIFFETELRVKLSKKYNLNLINASEPKLAREIFGKFLSKDLGISYKILKDKRTYRNVIKVKDIIFPYVRFKEPILNAVKSFYSSLEFNPYDFKQNNLELKKVEKNFRYHNIPEMTVGLGGIHGCVSPGIYTDSDEWIMEDIDGSSYYPNLGIKNELYPEHLSKVFCSTYENTYNDRQNIPKEDPVNYIYKIILNAIYGQSKEKNNYFHDPKYTFTITINGQLLILMLADILKAKVKGVLFYQFNTDGLTIGYHPSQKAAVKEAKELWSKITKIKLDSNFYKKMVIRDVNNYAALDDKGHIKRKGAAFIYSQKPEDKEIFYHKNASELVVPKALEAYFFKGIPYEQYIRECTDIYDFCAGVKVKSDFELKRTSIKDGQVVVDIIPQTVVRYYVSNDNSSLKKHYKPGSKRYKNVDNPKGKKKATGIVELRAKVNTTMLNVVNDKTPMKDYNINYLYYIQKARQTVQIVEPFVGIEDLFK